MKRIDYNLYMYKGVKVEYNSIKEWYIAKVYVNDLKLPLTINGSTQSSFKRIFNEQIEKYGGLRTVC